MSGEIQLLDLNTVPARADGSAGRVELDDDSSRPGEDSFPLTVERSLAGKRISEDQALELLQKQAYVSYAARHGITETEARRRDEGSATAPVRPESSVFQAVTARELCSQPDPPGAEELLGPLVRRGQRVVVGAHSGEGKTVGTRQMLRAITEGEMFLDWQGVGGVRALVMDAEQELWSIRGQLRDAGLHGSDAVDYLCVPDGLALDQDDDQVSALDRLLAEGGYAVVCADPLYKLHRGDSNDERAATDLMRLWDAWRARYGFALLLPMHCRKPQQGATQLSIHDLFGSSAYVRGAEVVLGLQLVRDGYSRLHFLKSRDPGLPVRERWGLLYDREQGFRRDPKDGEPATVDRLAELRQSDPSLTQAASAEALGVSLRTVERNWKATAPDTQESLLEGGNA